MQKHIRVSDDRMKTKVEGIARDALQLLRRKNRPSTRMKRLLAALRWWQRYTVDTIPGTSTNLQTRLVRVRREGSTVLTARHWIGTHMIEVRKGHGFKRGKDEAAWDAVIIAYRMNAFEFRENK